ncbi:hypothetical protein EXIGLDRAFT_325992 [Exidia glandulosa HHB12029]|uniref:Uncharacterized protein n=1 Tax=Exidia glandulosa HHB12029 TaxID=1314781 RepID=A0A165CTW1_EXIGL|nr:hypothetical protein EXIGLDRAFT_325992 [Exidia glandulosa HHB12029]
MCIRRDVESCTHCELVVFDLHEASALAETCQVPRTSFCTSPPPVITKICCGVVEIVSGQPRSAVDEIASAKHYQHQLCVGNRDSDSGVLLCPEPLAQRITPTERQCAPRLTSACQGNACPSRPRRPSLVSTVAVKIAPAQGRRVDRLSTKLQGSSYNNGRVADKL